MGRVSAVSADAQRPVGAVSAGGTAARTTRTANDAGGLRLATLRSGRSGVRATSPRHPPPRRIRLIRPGPLNPLGPFGPLVNVRPFTNGRLLAPLCLIPPGGGRNSSPGAIFQSAGRGGRQPPPRQLKEGLPNMSFLKLQSCMY